MDAKQIVLETALRRPEYLLLEAAEEERWAVYLLNSCEMENTMNKPHHGLETSELTKHLLRLWQRGWVECMVARVGHEQEFEQLPRAVPDAGLLRDQLVHGSGWRVDEEMLFFGLTPAGGAIWEALAVLDWAKCLVRKYDVWREEPRVMSISGAEQQLVEQAFALHQLYGTFEVATSGTEVWSTLKPWHARYWKTLPLGYQVRFQFVSCEDLPKTGENGEAHDRASRELKVLERCWRRTFEEIYADFF